MKKSQNQTQQQIAALKAHALELWNEDNSHAKELGLALLAVRAALKSQHGGFKKWWQSNKLSQARVSYCMRLASGKVAVARERRRSSFQGVALATKPIRKEMNEFLLFVSHFDGGKLEPVYYKFVDFVGHTLVNLGKLPGWTIRDTTNLHVQQASKAFQKSLNHLMRCLYNEKTPWEEDPAPEKKPVASTPTKAKAS